LTTGRVDVSIIIPTYNRLWALPQAVASCRYGQCQTEIIVIDDGSTDGTWEWLQSQDDIVSVRQDNWGKCWAVNKGFGIARGEYVRFLDSDDWLLADANDAQLKVARSSGADVVVAGCRSFFEDQGAERDHPWEHCDDFVAQQLGECSSSHYSAYLFRKSFMRDIPHRPEFALKDDRLLVLEVALANPAVVVWPEIAFVHRHHNRGRLQEPPPQDRIAANLQLLGIYRKTLTALERQERLTERRKRAAVKVLWPLAHWIAYSDLIEARRVAEWIRTLNPEFTPPRGGLLGILYGSLGFTWTERLLALRRALLLLAKSRSENGNCPQTWHQPKQFDEIERHDVVRNLKA
jgi:glycosyltransferase involved in cell wall biosynthesis